MIEGRFQAKSPDPVLGSVSVSYYLLVLKPVKARERFPLLVALHGRNGNGRDYLEVWRKEAEKRRFMVLAPNRDQPYSNEVFYGLVKEALKHYSAEKKKMYLAGVSAGALVGRWFLIARPAFWRGAVLIASPTGDQWTTEADVSRFPPVLFVHGEKDGQFPVQKIAGHVETLKSRGVRSELIQEAEGGHEHRPEWNEEIFDWIEKNT
ncbi:MAG: prolyl oligopeptidase family serine peptidase [Candidatus Omnitrophica bacterium]|nr:prolyl oligopeptidase family serine peptidase [Candidatus Omnitrophota bacterium]